MNFFIYLLLLVLLGLGLVYFIRFSSLSFFLEWINARPFPSDALWQQVERLVGDLAQERRMKCPELMVLPEFSPNALILHLRKDYLILSEGMVRALSPAELSAAIGLALSYTQMRRRKFLTRAALSLFPLGLAIQSIPLVLQYFFAPVLSMVMRAGGNPRWILKADQRTAEKHGAFNVAAALQKMAVLGRKLPLHKWNLAMDPLFLISPLSLEEDPFWLFPTQPDVNERRSKLFSNASP